MVSPCEVAAADGFGRIDFDGAGESVVVLELGSFDGKAGEWGSQDPPA